MKFGFAVILLASFAFSRIYCSLHHKTEEELSELFSTYVITSPVQVDSDGKFLSYDLKTSSIRKRRSAAHDPCNTTSYGPCPGNKDNDIYYNITAFGESYHIVLKQKDQLIGPNAKIVRHLTNTSIEEDLIRHGIYAGYVKYFDRSKVAMTNFDGLAGYIKTDKGEYFIEPIEQSQDENEIDIKPQRHIVYEKRDLLYKPEGKKGNRQQTLWPAVENMKFPSYEMLDDENIFDNTTKRSKRQVKKKKKIYNIEVLLTADDTVIEFHGNDRVQDYLITLMNIVNEIYHDDTIGHQINIIIVRISLLNKKDSRNLIAHDDPSVSLKNVCKWAHDMYNAGHEDSGSTYDHAIFLTRQKFGPTGMEGYAHVTGMCHPLRSCTLNHEDGFSSSFVVAHETGHVLGMEHDGEGNKCGDETSMGSIMAPLVQAAFHRYHWSRCSQYELKGHIRKFDCLLNNPHTPDWGVTPEYPGVYYSLDDQCRFDFGPGYKQCMAFQNLDVCRTLWCSHDDNPKFCKTKNGPPVDGTECAENMWCFKSHCVWRNQRQGPVDGAWGVWSSYGICSRSCGTGVMMRTRQCNRPRPAYGGKTCPGLSIEYGLCNKQSCVGSYDYRAEQCIYHQKKEYANRRHTWLPYESEIADLKCELFCTSKETNTILSMGSPVADGTRCSYDDPYSICINAECMKVGCDGIIGSDKRDDECGVCDGDGSQCRRINSTYRKLIRKPHNSYMKMFAIPRKARRVQIKEAMPDPTDIIALKNRRTGRYVLNQKGSISEGDVQRQIIDAGTKWTYTRNRDKEMLQSEGPLQSDYAIMLVSRNRGKRVRVHYSYVLHSSAVENGLYQYEIRRWYPCSVTCGEGTRLARFGCRNKCTKKWVRKTYCITVPPRRIRERCSKECESRARWHVGHWSTCSISCGQVGRKTRKVYCERQDSHESWGKTEDLACRNISAKPSSNKACPRTTCPSEWRTGNWSLCSVSCGSGIRKRRVACVSTGKIVSDVQCLGTKPMDVEDCHRPGCSEKICERDESNSICNIDSMAKYCSVAGFYQLCCHSCRSRYARHSQGTRVHRATKNNNSRSPR
uniref:A disintegrin and metalloproteinase with thrombospondin motifs 3-like n=1 Tax=Styela clava TaxID=7725 RepID=UPI00193A4BD8|nr:A disintegrin and metalloproteinase with thrombospondin motifs 3-like [Styela clava]